MTAAIPHRSRDCLAVASSFSTADSCAAFRRFRSSASERLLGLNIRGPSVALDGKRVGCGSYSGMFMGCSVNDGLMRATVL